MMIYETYSEQETMQLGRKIAENIQPGSVCALIGGFCRAETAESVALFDSQFGV